MAKLTEQEIHKLADEYAFQYDIQKATLMAFAKELLSKQGEGKTAEAVKYMISVWNEVQGNWRERPDHVQQKFLEAEKEIK